MTSVSPDKYQANDVISYRPYERWAMEGTAIARQDGDGLAFYDTFWGSTPTRIDEPEGEVIFNLDSYEPVDEETWLKYAPEDRQAITSQHGLQIQHYIAKGATESIQTQITQARVYVAEARSELDAAIRRLEWRWAELNRLELSRDTNEPQKPRSNHGSAVQ